MRLHDVRIWDSALTSHGIHVGTGIIVLKVLRQELAVVIPHVVFVDSVHFGMLEGDESSCSAFDILLSH